MKTLQDLFQLIGKAIEQNDEKTNTWFVSFSGHVNKISVRYYFTGWESEGKGHSEGIEQVLNVEGVQSIYWFIKTRLV